MVNNFLFVCVCVCVLLVTWRANGIVLYMYEGKVLMDINNSYIYPVKDPTLSITSPMYRYILLLLLLLPKILIHSNQPTISPVGLQQYQLRSAKDKWDSLSMYISKCYPINYQCVHIQLGIHQP